MTNEKEYFRPSVLIEQEKAIEDLFEKYGTVRNYYGGKKGKFVEDAIRRLLIFFEDKKDDDIKIFKEENERLKKRLREIEEKYGE